MNHATTRIDDSAAKPRRTARHVWMALGAAAFAASASPPARAVDGCLVLLCLAAPDWRAITQCVSPVRQVLRDLARGKPFPTCSMAGATPLQEPASVPAHCPPQYVYSVNPESGAYPICRFAGSIALRIDGAPWARVWWSASGESVTEFFPRAKAQLGRWDTRFEDDHAAWLAAQPPSSQVGGDR